MPARFKNFWIIIGSCLFYAWGAPKFLFILLATSVFDYYWSLLIYRKSDNQKAQKLIVAISVVWNIFLLSYFKYANFFVGEFNYLLTSFGFEPFSWSYVILPVGISFFVFHKISYIIDIYRGSFAPAKSLIDFLVYILLFPQLVAGPIIRYHDIANQIKERQLLINDVFEGFLRFCVGLGKKVLIADSLAEVANLCFDTHPDSISSPQAWLGIICYSLQIYYDFSGYSDMAIGLGRMMGFRFLENFNCPYIAQNITEFWKRWHISLSNWMREYLYIPLGGNRVSPARCYFNLWIVFIFSGLWHGASWNFLIWGIFHGSFLAFDKLCWLKISAKIPKIFNIILTFFVVIIGWLFFRAETLPKSINYFKKLFSFETASEVLWLNLISERGLGMLVIGLFFAFIPAWPRAGKLLPRFYESSTTSHKYIWHYALALALFILASAALINSDFHPFIYFRF